MLCALPKELRKKYVASLSKLVKTGGIVISIVFRSFHSEIDGPPFIVEEKEMSDLFLDHFDLAMVEQSRFEPGLELIESEQLYIYRKN